MTFRQDAPLIVQYGISYGMMVPVDLALVCLVPEYARIFLLFAAIFFVFLLLNKKMHPNAVTVDADSISCYRGEQLVWAFQRTQIVELKKSNRYRCHGERPKAERLPGQFLFSAWKRSQAGPCKVRLDGREIKEHELPCK